MSLQVSYKRQFVLMIMLLLVLLAVIEGIVLVYDYFNPTCDFMTNEVSKNLEYDVKKQICKTWTNFPNHIDPLTGIASAEPNQHYPNLNINSYGFRGSEILKEKPDDTFRIFIVGGSTTFSIRALSDQTTIPGYLQENLDNFQINKKIEVVNAGIPNIASTDELQLVQTKIIQFNPDVIILYDGTNDVQRKYPWIKGKGSGEFLLNFYKKYFNFYQTPYVFKNIFGKTTPSANFDWDKKALLWKTNMITICDLGKPQGYETVVILQPILGSGNKTLSEQERKNFELYDQANVLIGYQKFADELNDLENYCTITADFRNIFDDKNETVYFDEAHISYEDNIIVAEKIFELIRPLVN